MTWQLTGVTNESIVKERYWLNFRPGEVRTCANCHGINDNDQAGPRAPTNAPLALRQLLRFWRTNAANAYALTVNNGTGSGIVGAGSIVTLTANPPPAGKFFLQWTGAAVSNALAHHAVHHARQQRDRDGGLFKSSVARFTGVPMLSGTNLLITASAFANQPWVLQASTDLVLWTDVTTNFATAAGLSQFTNVFGPTSVQGFFRLRSP